jgi:hypothetical protein
MSQPEAKNWIDLEAWGKGMDGFKLPSSNDIAGKELTLHFNTGNLVFKYIFTSAASLTCTVLEGPDKGQSKTGRYEAIVAAPQIYFVDLYPTDRPEVSLSMALDLNTGKATVIYAEIPGIEEMGRGFMDRTGRGIDLSMVKIEIRHANVNPISPDKPIVPHERTSDLVGKTIRYAYSCNHVYEHIYLNERLFTWHCLEGLEKGLADTEICDHLKIAPEIYLFIWREKVMPTFGAVLINLKDMRSNGKTFGLDVSSNKYVNFTMGSHIESITGKPY